MATQISDKISILLILALLGWGTYEITKHYRRNNEIKRNIAYTKAVIYEIYSVRYSDYCKYKFKNDGKIYFGKGGYYSSFGEKGDSIWIVYNANKPIHNKTLASFNNYNVFKIIGVLLLGVILSWLRFRKY